MSADSTRLWPFGRTLAIAWMVFVWCSYLLFSTFAAQQPGWHPALMESTGLLVVLVVSLVPLTLLAIVFLAQQRGSIAFQGLTLDFTQGVTPSATMTVAPNLGLPEGDLGSQVMGSGKMELIKGLADAAGRRVASLDLGDGSSWRVTRAYAFCFGAAQSGSPKVVVFVGRDHGVPRRFLGWLHPEEFCRALEAKDTRYRQAAARALSHFDRWNTQLAQTPVPVPPAPPIPTPPGMPEPGDPQARERFLLRELAAFESEEAKNPGRRDLLTVERLNQIAREYVRTEAIDLDASRKRQVEAFLDAESEWIGLVRKRKYVSLLAREDGERALLRQLIRASRRTSAHA